MRGGEELPLDSVEEALCEVSTAEGQRKHPLMRCAYCSVCRAVLYRGDCSSSLSTAAEASPSACSNHPTGSWGGGVMMMTMSQLGASVGRT